MRIRVGHNDLREIARCLAPGCSSNVTFDTHRPHFYCSGACRNRAMRDQNWLVAEAQRLQSELGRVHPRSREAVELRSRRRLVLWHLIRYAPALVDPEDLLQALAERADR